MSLVLDVTKGCVGSACWLGGGFATHGVCAPCSLHDSDGDLHACRISGASAHEKTLEVPCSRALRNVSLSKHARLSGARL